MIDGMNGSSGPNTTEPLVSNLNQSVPPSGSPAGAPPVEPDVEVALSELAQARLAAMQSNAPSSDDQAAWDASNGSMSFGVDKGGFEWSLDVQEASTNQGASFQSQDSWANDDNVVNGVLVDDANAANRIALGDASLKPSS